MIIEPCHACDERDSRIAELENLADHLMDKRDKLQTEVEELKELDDLRRKTIEEQKAIIGEFEKTLEKISLLYGDGQGSIMRDWAKEALSKAKELK